MQYITEVTVSSFTLDIFPTNLGDISDNHCDSFHKAISAMEEVESDYAGWLLLAA
jgi:hypothetical protein